VIIKVPELWDVQGLGKAIITQWYVKGGDSIKEDTPVCQIMAGKVTVEVEGKVKGKVTKIFRDINAEIVPGDDLLEVET